jgi:hypothetical protein
LYKSANEITTLKKHVYADHFMITKIFKEEINSVLKEPYEKQLTNKRFHVNGTTIFIFFIPKKIYKKR